MQQQHDGDAAIEIPSTADDDEHKQQSGTPAHPSESSFELQLQSMQRRLSVLETIVNKQQNDAVVDVDAGHEEQGQANIVTGTAGQEQEMKEGKEEEEEEEEPMSTTDCVLHYIGLFVLKVVTFLHLFHSFVPRLILRTTKKNMELFSRCAAPTVALVAVFYILFPSIVISCLLWSPVAVYQEIQSWMIAYWMWAFCVCLYWCMIAATLGSLSNKRDTINRTLWAVVGVTLPPELQQEKGYLSIVLASLLPAAAAGFVANYALEEKFLLECNYMNPVRGTKYASAGEVCTVEGDCCQVISSHDLTNIFEFGGSLVSNVIGAFAVVRILAWLMTKGDKTLMRVSERKK